mgnify:CR=1 FL=1
MSEKAITPYEPENDDLDAFQQVSGDDLLLPVRKLVQGSSRVADARHAGEFFDTMAETYKPSLRIAILALRKSRALFAAGSFDQPPLCVSDDAIIPRGRVEIGDTFTLTGPTCPTCPFSAWGSDPNGGQGHACKLSYNLLGYDLDDPAPFVLRVSGTSIRAWRQYLTSRKLKHVPAYAIETLIHAVPQVFDRGKAYVLTFAAGEKLSPEECAAMRREAAAMQDVQIRLEAQEDAAEESGEDDETPFE